MNSKYAISLFALFLANLFKVCCQTLPLELETPIHQIKSHTDFAENEFCAVLYVEIPDATIDFEKSMEVGTISKYYQDVGIYILQIYPPDRNFEKKCLKLYSTEYLSLKVPLVDENGMALKSGALYMLRVKVPNAEFIVSKQYDWGNFDSNLTEQTKGIPSKKIDSIHTEEKQVRIDKNEVLSDNTIVQTTENENKAGIRFEEMDFVGKVLYLGNNHPEKNQIVEYLNVPQHYNTIKAYCIYRYFSEKQFSYKREKINKIIERKAMHSGRCVMFYIESQNTYFLFPESISFQTIKNICENQ